MSIMYARQRASASESGWPPTRSQATTERSTRLDARRYRSRWNPSISRGFAVIGAQDDRTPHLRADPRTGCSGDDRQVSARVVQPLGALAGHDDLVLDPDAEPSLQVDPRLVREGHAGLERRLVALDDIRGFVQLEPDPVARPVDEPIPIPGIGDELARGPVDLLGGHPRTDRLERRLLRRAYDPVDRPFLVRGLPDEHRPRDVGVVVVP